MSGGRDQRPTNPGRSSQCRIRHPARTSGITNMLGTQNIILKTQSSEHGSKSYYSHLEAWAILDKDCACKWTSVEISECRFMNAVIGIAVYLNASQRR